VKSADGDRDEIMALHVKVKPIASPFTLSDEATADGHFARDDIAGLDVLATHVEWLRDAFSGPSTPIVR
jgi:hypothetical protein